MNSLRTGATVSLVGVLAAQMTAAQSTGFVQLVTGDFAGWHVENTTADNFSIVDGALVVSEPGGWLKSDRVYADFELDIEFRFMTDDADSGIFIRTAGANEFARGWPSESYQVQLRNPIGDSPFPPVGGIFRHGMPAGETDYDEDAARLGSRATGEWQRLFIRAVGGELNVELNDVRITTATDIANASGHIGIQGETGTLEFRSIAIREL